MNDDWISLLIIGFLIFLLALGCHSCNEAIDKEYPPIHTDWKAIERENEARRNYTPPPLSEAEQREKDYKDSVWKANRIRQSELFFKMMRAAGEAEGQWKREHEGESYNDVMSSYGEGYDEGFYDRMNGAERDETEYGISYDEGYRDGYGY